MMLLQTFHVLNVANFPTILLRTKLICTYFTVVTYNISFPIRFNCILYDLLTNTIQL